MARVGASFFRMVSRRDDAFGEGHLLLLVASGQITGELGRRAKRMKRAAVSEGLAAA
jgi:hypothetical protein